MNTIIETQNQPKMLSLLRARSRIYSRAKRIQGTIVLVTLSLPVLSLAAATWFPAAKAFITLVALFIGLCEILVLDRWHKARMKCAAKLQEEFDCVVLDMPPNDFLVGGNVDHEEVFELSEKPFDEEGERRLRDWYPVVVDQVPLPVGRILCQRENLLYDSSVRKTYGAVLSWGLAVVIVLLSLWSLAMDLKLEALILTVLVPAMPIITWALREKYRQGDTIDTLVRLKAESEKLWKSAAAGMDEGAAAERSRELQDAMFSHRVSSPLVFDFLYRYRRNDLEAQMNAGAQHLVGDYLNKNTAVA